MPEKPSQPEGDKFLKERYWDKAGFREAVEDTVRKKKRLGEETASVSQRPEQQIPLYLKRIKQIVERKGTLFRELSLYPKFIIQPENITDDYIRGVLLGNFAELKGYDREKLKDPKLKEQIIKLFEKETGENLETYQIPQAEREQIIEQTMKDQKTSLDRWFEYLTGPESEHYPDAFKYWAFAEMTKLGVLDRHRVDFTKRTEQTIAPFPELNQQALSFILDEVRRKRLDQPSQMQLTEAERKKFQKHLLSENFGKLYAWALEYVHSLKLPKERLAITKGEWKRFAKGSSGQELADSIHEFNTGWCIAGIGTAESYLTRSDVWIYFSEDAEGRNSIPRSAIVTDGARVSEVRGIAQTEDVQQHLDSYITPVVADKLQNMPGGSEWHKGMEDMKKLAETHFKHLQDQPLTKEDLIFLYEVTHPIKNMGYGKDPRIEEVLSKRDAKSDLSFALGISRERISISQEEALSGNILFHYGYLYLWSLTSAKGLKLPDQIGGDLNLGGLTSAKGLKLPDQIGGDLNLGGLTSAKGLKLPDQIGGDLNLGHITSTEGLQLPQQIGGDLHLGNLTSVQREELRQMHPHLASKIQ